MKPNFYSILFSIFFMLNAQIQAQQPCVLYCYSERVINASSTCATLVTWDMTISSTSGDCGILTTEIFDDSGMSVPNPIPGYYNEQPLVAVVTSGNTGNVCNTGFSLRDIDPPVLSRRETYTSINCDVAIEEISPIIDECSDFTIEYTVDEFCDPIKGLVREYTWLAEDIAENTDQMIVEYELQFDPTHILFPDIYTIACDDPLATTCGGAPCPDISGMLQISPDNCTDLTIEYEDDIFNLPCGGSKKVLRTWNVYDPCELVYTNVQTIILEDVSGPVITTPSLPSVIPFDTWINNAIPIATAVDACGSVVMFNYTDAFDPACDVLDITRTWTAEDDCGNISTASVNFQVHYKFSCKVPPIDKITCGEAVNIGVDVKDGIPPYTYNWTVKGDWVITTSPVLPTITAISGSDKALFSVEVTDALGCETTCSRQGKCKKAKFLNAPIHIAEIQTSDNNLTIRWEAEDDGLALIQVWNIMGRQVAEMEEMAYSGINTVELQLKDNVPGLYLVSININGYQMVQKVVVH